jgi:hypothetical protein
MKTLREQIKQIARELVDFSQFAEDYPEPEEIKEWAVKLSRILKDTKETDPPITEIRIEDGPWLPVCMTTKQIIKYLEGQGFEIEPIDPEKGDPKEGVAYFNLDNTKTTEVNPFDGYLAIKEGA